MWAVPQRCPNVASRLRPCCRSRRRRPRIIIGVPDKQRGEVLKAFVVTDRKRDDGFTKEIQDLVHQRLSQHE